jgi:hypothetical protein
MTGSLELRLQRARDCSASASVLRRASCDERRWIGRQIANVLAALPAAQAELASLPESRALEQLLRQVGHLETILLDLAGS